MNNENKLQFIEAMLNWFASPSMGRELDVKFLSDAYDDITSPAWVSVERLPEPNIFPEGKTFPLVLVCLTDGCVDTDAYDTDNKVWCKYDGEVEYWMPLPQLPVKKGDEQ